MFRFFYYCNPFVHNFIFMNLLLNVSVVWSRAEQSNNVDNDIQDVLPTKHEFL